VGNDAVNKAVAQDIDRVLRLQIELDVQPIDAKLLRAVGASPPLVG